MTFDLGAGRVPGLPSKHDLQRRQDRHFLRIPYNWNRPTVERAKKTWWDPESDKFIVPRVYGWGYAFNFAKFSRKK